MALPSIAPVLGVARVRPSAHWWRDVLGFSLDAREGVFAPSWGPPDGVYAILTLGDADVHLQRRDADDQPPSLAGRNALARDVYVRVDDVEATHDGLVARGAHIVQAPTDMPYGLRECVVETPDGHRISFATPLPG